ncbi:hypothetical protein OAP71_03500 [Pelagibacteraceae bacterium]|nr:hypothetical protein [Pelagibacteraceae bacterium]
MKKLLAIIVLGLLCSCTISDSQMKSVSTNTGIKIQGGIKEIIFLNKHKINSKLTVELIKKGIKVKPFSIREKVTEKSEKKDVEYNLASARYGLKIESDFKQVCVFSTNQNNDFIFTLIDIRTNDIIDIFEKRGPNGKCPPLTPIYITYANYLLNFK